MIGVIDSGVGGLSVWKELTALMPGEDYVYVSDGAYCPYGPKSPEEVRRRVSLICGWLTGQGAEIIVVACNTATAAAISCLRSHFDIPFIGMEPAIKPAALQSGSGVVGVLATAGTFKGRLYLETSGRFAGKVRVIEQVGSGLVELVEAGILDGPQAESLLHKYIDPMLEQGADHIVLGCTHYPFLKGTMERIIGGRAQIVNPAPAVAAQCRRILERTRPIADGVGESIFYSTGETTVLQLLARQIRPDIRARHFRHLEI